MPGKVMQGPFLSRSIIPISGAPDPGRHTIFHFNCPLCGSGRGGGVLKDTKGGKNKPTGGAALH